MGQPGYHMNLQAIIFIYSATLLTAMRSSGIVNYAYLLDTILMPIYYSKHPVLLAEWESALEESFSTDERLVKAERIFAAYTVWNPRREQAVEEVFGNADLRLGIISQVLLENLGAFSSVSKRCQTSVDLFLSRSYFQGCKMNWNSLLKDILKSTMNERPVLTRFLMRHWPKSDDPIVSALLIQALDLFKSNMIKPVTIIEIFPYMPGHYVLCKALESVDALSLYTFPFEVFYYEDIDDIKEDARTRHNFEDIKSLLASSNEKAISNFCTVFPESADLDGEAILLMSWEPLEPESCLLLAIFYHNNTNSHEALMKHLHAVVAVESNWNWTTPLSTVLMNSDLSTSDILALNKTHKFVDDVIYQFPHRFLDILSLEGYEEIKHDLELMLEEDFCGPYAKEVCVRMCANRFYVLALIAGATDEFLMKAVLDDKDSIGNIAGSLLCPAIMTGRSAELVEFLMEKRGNFSLYKGFAGVEIPVKYLGTLFKDNEFAFRYAWNRIHYNANQRDSVFQVLRVLSPSQLSGTLVCYCMHSSRTDLLHVYICNDLIQQLGTDKRETIDEFFDNSGSSLPAQIALVAQNLDTLESIGAEAQGLHFKTAVKEAIHLKLAYR